MAGVPEVGWSEFADMPEMTCYCRCTEFPGFRFRSHTKLVRYEGKWLSLTEKPCPNCGQHSNIRASESDPEEWTVRR